MSHLFSRFNGFNNLLSFMGSGDGISSLNYKLICRIAAANSMSSHLNNINKVQLLEAGWIAEVCAFVYIPFGKRGKTYVANLLRDMNKTIEQNAKELAMHFVEELFDVGVECINIGTKDFELDLNNIPIPTFQTVPLIVFELEEMLDELNRCDLWPEDPRLSTRNNIMQYICACMEKYDKIILPEELYQKLTSKEFEEFEHSELTEPERAYLDKYLKNTNFFLKEI